MGCTTLYVSTCSTFAGDLSRPKLPPAQLGRGRVGSVDRRLPDVRGLLDGARVRGGGHVGAHEPAHLHERPRADGAPGAQARGADAAQESGGAQRQARPAHERARGAHQRGGRRERQQQQQEEEEVP